MTVRINASSAGLTETVDTSGILEFQTANTSALVIDASQNANFTGTGAIILPNGTTVQRPTGVNGMMRYNTGSKAFEAYLNGGWVSVTNAAPYSITYLIVAGGGGGGGQNGYGGAGGGGAGGLLTGSATLTPGTDYTITVGAGGANGAASTRGSSGTNSTAFTFTAVGGGGGGNYTGTGGSGGSGGGGGRDSGGSSGGAGTSGQGFAGGAAGGVGNYAAGGGGGAGQVGFTGNQDNVSYTAPKSQGGNGVSSTITGVATFYAGGGAGGYQDSGGPPLGGSGGGGNGGADAFLPTAGTANTGGGGGGGSNAAQPSSFGGSGVVIVSYISTIQRGTGGTVTTYTSGNVTYQVHTFNTSGIYSA